MADQDIFPGVRYRPTVGLQGEHRLDRVAGVIWHLSASEAVSLFGYFDGQSGGVESHFHVPREAKYRTEQYRPCDREADANYRGNSWVGSDGLRWGFLSIEFQGADPATGLYTPHQVKEGLAITNWAQDRYGFARRLAPGYRSQGIGYHVQHGAGPGLDAWSNARGKTCPGGPRIRQFLDVVLPTFVGGPVLDRRPLPPPPVVPTTPPAFPLPRGSYFGPKEGPDHSVSGYFQRLPNGRPGHPGLLRWQERMDVRGWRITPDGLYGEETKRVAGGFQDQLGYSRDGLVGPMTWAAAWRAPVT